MRAGARRWGSADSGGPLDGRPRRIPRGPRRPSARSAAGVGCGRADDCRVALLPSYAEALDDRAGRPVGDAAVGDEAHVLLEDDAPRDDPADQRVLVVAEA